jgi:hypothetical protein
MPVRRLSQFLGEAMDDPVLQEARRSFRAFYSIATPDDATWFDALIVAHAALTQGMSIPRELVPAEDRGDLEHACDDAERNFMQARDRVRECPTFRKLVLGDQRRIALVLFELYLPTE